MYTGVVKTEHTETTYVEQIVELEDVTRGTSAEIEKTYTKVHISPPDERKQRRLLSTNTRENFEPKLKSSAKILAVGDRWKTEPMAGLVGYTTVTRIYDHQEYDTKVITLDIEVIGTLNTLGVQIPAHSWTTIDIDAETGITTYQETIMKRTVINSRRTNISVKKLLKRETSDKEL
ncbi:unnamed protein product [Adineta steineri]|uniref:Uncharacterized protein n=1 Tax=Adineta steineri TaxID=433720 RepID=A0A819R8Z3_9BILA|nr:unnamed protein product [Adineta steineri]CAF4043679.1 unnamed protein product [Adineta steineri]